MIETLKNEYWTEPSILENIRQSLAQETRAATDFGEICRKVSPQITETLDVSGAEHIPDEGPLIVIKNHPCHCDSLLLDTVFSARPDVRWLAKDSPVTQAVSPKNTILLRKNNHRAHPEDIRTMQQHLQGGGSLLSTPWGCMDYQAGTIVTPERAATNAIRYASYARAALLPIYIDAQWATKGLPLAEATVTIQEPIMPTPDGTLDEDYIRVVVTDMYKRYVVLK